MNPFLNLSDTCHTDFNAVCCCLACVYFCEAWLCLWQYNCLQQILYSTTDCTTKYTLLSFHFLCTQSNLFFIVLPCADFCKYFILIIVFISCSRWIQNIYKKVFLTWINLWCDAARKPKRCIYVLLKLKISHFCTSCAFHQFFLSCQTSFRNVQTAPPVAWELNYLKQSHVYYL